MVLVTAALAGATLLMGVLLFNGVVRDRNLMREAWSGIDVQLKRRVDLVPALADAVKAYGQHEKKVFETASQRDVVNGLKNLLALAERYPDLKASENFLKLQKDLVDIEDNLQYARRYYNGCVRNYNTRIQSFPGVILAKTLNFQPAEFFQVEYATERQTPEVDL